jgi:hypothetical protein
MARSASPVAVYGHIHHAYVRRLNGLTVVNAGSVSLSLDGDALPPTWSSRTGSSSTERVAYDVESVSVADLLPWATQAPRRTLPGCEPGGGHRPPRGSESRASSADRGDPPGSAVAVHGAIQQVSMVSMGCRWPGGGIDTRFRAILNSDAPGCVDGVDHFPFLI